MSVRWTRIRIFGSLAALAVLTATGAGAVLCRPGDNAVASPKTSEDRAIAVFALGRLEPQSRVLRLAPPSSAVSGRIERLFVREGDVVEAGKPLATLDSFDRLQAAVEEADAKLKVAQARLEQVKAGAKPAEIAAQQSMANRADAALASTENELRRAETLWASKSISASEYEQRRTEYDKARHEVGQARSNLEATRHVRDVDIRAAEAEVMSARAAHKRAARELDVAEIRMPIHGTVLKIHAMPGEVVGSKGIMEVGDVSSMVAVAQVYEADVPRLRIGDPATVRVASASTQIPGKIVEIGRIVGRKDVLDNDPVSDTDARVVEVRIRLTGDDLASIASLSNARVHVAITPGR